MNAVAFDTHAFVKRLVGAGMPEAQAEVLADEQRRLIDDRLSTKEDVANLENVTKLEIERLRAELKADIAALRADLGRDIAAVRADVGRDIAALRADVDLGAAALRADVDRNIAALRADLGRDIAETKADILKWMIGAMGFQTVVILGAVLALSRFAR